MRPGTENQRSNKHIKLSGIPYANMIFPLLCYILVVDKNTALEYIGIGFCFKKGGKRLLYPYVKRVLDCLIVFITMPISFPLMGIIAIAVKATSKGQVLFTQRRIGKNCRHFTIYKFRTMRVDAPSDVPTHMMENPDAYFTPIGKFLRKVSLDEVPQIFNILKGDISIIGPRPALWNQYDLIAERDKYGANDILPGLTGLAQVSGRDDLPIPVKAQYDNEYKSNMSIALDVKIFFLTIVRVLRGSGVTEGAQKTEREDKTE